MVLEAHCQGLQIQSERREKNKNKTNSADPDETVVAFHLGLHCVQLSPFSDTIKGLESFPKIY